MLLHHQVLRSYCSLIWCYLWKSLKTTDTARISSEFVSDGQIVAKIIQCESGFIKLLLRMKHWPYESTQHPESQGVAQQAWDEDNQVKERVELVHGCFPVSHIGWTVVVHRVVQTWHIHDCETLMSFIVDRKSENCGMKWKQLWNFFRLILLSNYC